uniref:cytochrome c oxidase subunit II n=1 Tax=Halticus minutus TaxID=2917254 RepID=UPI001F13CCD4|nr:cytochrome c oxidase subunit II [Halticus minutus]UKT60743.1 cytochrome c oxidase subunit 2 [Halticus minutus]
MPSLQNIMMQNANSNIMEQMIFFHDHTLMILILITFTVMYMLYFSLMNKLTNRYLMEGQKIETIWTITPAFMLIMIALPSLKLLYLMDEVNNPTMSIKTLGNQWYWSYEYSDIKDIQMDSYMKPTNTLEENEMRLLEVDNRLILPTNMNIRILVTSTDVIHSWTIPSLGIKIDGTPGRLNQGNLNINRPGILYGQCSEICGANHSFMPIVIEGIPFNMFLKWINNYN